MRLNKALCVLGAVICASAALLIINNTKSEQDTYYFGCSSSLQGKGFYLCLDRFIAKLVDIIYRRIQIN